MHPLFLLFGIWYCLKGELFLFLLSALVAVQHECAHAFAAAKLGYRLNAIILMPFGAVIDGDMRGISLKDEIFVAICGPLCNLFTAVFFIAIWWLHPTMYAFTDTACYSSLAIAAVNLLPAYPLDGGRILKCLLARFLLKKYTQEAKAEAKAHAICRIITLLFAAAFLIIFLLLCAEKTFNFTLLVFGIFLFAGALGTSQKNAVYDKLPIERPSLKKGLEIRRVAVLSSCPIKDTLRFVSKGCFLVLEVYDEQENHLFDLSQTELSSLFARAPSPYTTLSEFFRQKE
jgi:Zn-dependent protease